MKNVNIPITPKEYIEPRFEAKFYDAVDNVLLFYNEMCERNENIKKSAIMNNTDGNIMIIFKGNKHEADAVCSYITDFVKEAR